MNSINGHIPKLSILVPCYNEELVLDESAKILKNKLLELIEKKNVHKDSFILLINDGSKDKTPEIISSLHQNNNGLFKGLLLSRNFGHQNALSAGLHYVADKCDISISLDSDLQDDISVIDLFIEEYKKGNEVVYGVRSSRNKDTILKKLTAETYYKILHFLGIQVVYNHADYRLVSSQVLKHFKNYSEFNIYLRGIFPLIGFKHSTVAYQRGERFAGESKYNLLKMLALAWNGISSFSSIPLKLISILSILILIFSFFVGIYALHSWWTGNIVTGWTSLLLVISIIGGLQMLAIGVIGEYIAKIYQEVKNRPKYIVEKIIS